MCIGGRAFCSNRNLVRIVHGLPKGLLRLEVRVFAGCRSLKRELVIPSSVVFVGALYSKNQQLLWNLGFLLLKDLRELIPFSCHKTYKLSPCFATRIAVRYNIFLFRLFKYR